MSDLTPYQKEMLRWVRERGDEGFEVYGIPERQVVEALVGRGLVREERDPLVTVGYRARLYPAKGGGKDAA